MLFSTALLKLNHTHLRGRHASVLHEVDRFLRDRGTDDIDDREESMLSVVVPFPSLT
jgi:hypothetical protein